MEKNTHYIDFSNANTDKISSASTTKGEAKQRAKNYMRLKDGYVEPKDVVLGDKTALIEDWFPKQERRYREEDMINFAEFVATYADKNRNVNGKMLHAKSKYDEAERTIDLLEIWLKKFKNK
jgi:hypothetical protein